MKKRIVSMLILSILISGCSIFTTKSFSITNSFFPKTETPTATIISTITPLPTSTPTATQTLTPTITATQGPTPLAGYGYIKALCYSRSGIDVDINGKDFGYLPIKYDIKNGTYEIIWKPEKQIDSWDNKEEYFQNTEKTDLLNLSLTEKQVDNYLYIIKSKFDYVKPVVASKNGDFILVFFVKDSSSDDSISANFFIIREDKTIEDLRIPSTTNMIQVTQASRNQKYYAVDYADGIFILDMETGKVINDMKNVWAVRFSPDSTKISYTNDSGTWISNVDGENQVNILKRGENADWSQDGTKLIFTINNKLFTSSIDGTNISQIKEYTLSAFNPEWVRISGRNEVLFWTFSNELMIINLDTGRVRSLHNKTDIPPFFTRWDTVNWSNDGHWFVTRYEGQQSGDRELYSVVCNLDEYKCTSLDFNGSGRASCLVPSWLNQLNSYNGF